MLPGISAEQLKSNLQNLTIAAWIAGIVDGEGSIAIQKSGLRYRARVSIFNTNIDFIAQIYSVVGGQIVCEKPKKVNHKIGFHLRIPESVVVPFLAAILPYLVIKKRQALYVLAFRQGATTYGFSTSELAERIHQECKALNQKGR